MCDIYVSHGNEVLKSNDKIKFRIFNLPANWESDEKIQICNEAPEICREMCYAYRRQKGKEKIVKGGRVKNYYETLKKEFVQDMIKEILGTCNYYKNKEDVEIFFRIHESGDFYDETYLEKWILITNYFKEKYKDKITFVAYTKQIILLNNYINANKLKLEDINIKFIYSVMDIDKWKNKKYENTYSNKKNTIDIAENIRAKSNKLSYYIVYDESKKIPERLKECKIKTLGCARCKVCYKSYKDVGTYPY